MSAPWLKKSAPDPAPAGSGPEELPPPPAVDGPAEQQQQPSAEELQKQLAMLGHRRAPQAVSDSSDDSDSEEDERLRPPGPLDPEHCLVSGPGVSGGSAGAAVTFIVTLKDSTGKRITEGGAYVAAHVEPKSLAPKDEQVAVIIKDNGDGSYTGVYTVSARGNYELTVEINGTPTGGSPFPVFFSPPEAKQEADGSTSDAAATSAPTNSLAATAQEIAAALQPDMARLNAANQAAAQILAQQNSMGSKAHASGVVLPSDEEVQKRSVLVGNLNADINPEQLRQLFGFCGSVNSCSLVGAAKEYALVEYSKEEEATSAQAMNNMSVMGSLIKVEGAKSAYMASPQGAPDPYQALQAQQLAQMQLAQSQQQSLAEQVAQMRAAAKSLPGMPLPVVAAPNNSQSQKAAALAAAAALSKRLTGIGGPAATFRPPSPRAGRAYSPPIKRSNRARSASPRSRNRRLGRTDNRAREAERLKEAEKELQHRSRSRHRSRSKGHDRSSERRRRHRSSSREHRSSTKQDSSRERRHKRSERSKSPLRRHGSKDRDSRRRDGNDKRRAKERSSRKEPDGSRKRGERDSKSARGSERRRSPAEADLPASPAKAGSAETGSVPAAEPATAAEPAASPADGAAAPAGDAAALDVAVAASSPAAAPEDAPSANGHAEDGTAAPGKSGHREGRRYRRSDAPDDEEAPTRKRHRSASPDADDRRQRRHEKHIKREKGEKHRVKERKHKSRRSERDAKRLSPAPDAGSLSPAAATGADEQEQLRKLALEKFEDSKQEAE